MGLDASSWYLSQLQLQSSAPQRRFTVGGSDYSERVQKWPRFKMRWDRVQPVDLTINLANDDNALLFFKTTKTKLRSTCAIQIGFTHPTSGDEFVTFYEGTVDKVRYASGVCDITLLDKLKPLGERTVGTQDSHATWTDSSLPSDIAWDLVTSYGALSNIQSTSNPDIDYQTWLDWAAVWSADAVYMNADFSGCKVTEALSKLARMTRSAIFNDYNEIEFRRFSDASSLELTLTEDEYMDAEVLIEDGSIINKQHVWGGYNVASGDWGVLGVSVNTSSVNSYGLREEVLKDENIWFVNSANAVNQAQRLLQFTTEPGDQYRVKTSLFGLQRAIGETAWLNDTFMSVVTSGAAFRIMALDIDTDKCMVTMDLDNGQVLQPFILDDAYLGILDQNYNFLL